MLLIEHAYLVPGTQEYRTARTFLPIDTPEFNPNSATQANTALREALGKNGTGRAVWCGGRYDGQVIFNGHGSDLLS